MVTINGNPPRTNRVITGLHSFDSAFVNAKGSIGFPLGKMVEIYGPTHCGKSTITYGIAGILAKHQSGNIGLADFEGFDPDFLTTVLENVGFDGALDYINEKEDEETLDMLIATLKRKDVRVGILDSIGAISPISEQQGELGDSNMGRRAFLLAQFSRKALKLLRDKPDRSILMINHAYPRIGGLGMSSPGGEVKNYISSVRINVKRMRWKNKYEEFPDGSYIIEGSVVKNRWGLKDKKFNLFILSGAGIHYGLTAMYDAMQLKLVDRGKVIKIGDTSFGTLKTVINEARQGNLEFFIPFANLLSSYSNVDQVESIEDETEDEENNDE